MARRKKVDKQLVPAARGTTRPAAPDRLLDDVRNLIRQAREATARAVNVGLVLLYWEVGRRIRTEILKEKRAGYGEEIISTLSNKLTAEFGNGFSQPNLSRMTRFAEVFPDRDIVTTLSAQLGWSHVVEIVHLPDDLQRDFYAEMCRVERWSVRTLRAKVQGMLFERTGLSRKPAELARQELEALRDEDRLTPDLVFRDPYVLDFLGLADTYSEKDLETAILRELQQVILELGAGFAFVGRQKRIVIDGEDFSIDLLFYHRRLRRLIAVDLKIGNFQAADKGQMELYLRWLERHEMQAGEEPLRSSWSSSTCSSPLSVQRIRPRGGIRVASYLTELPPRPLLQQKLHDAMLLARARLEDRRTR
jgi:predicted nuclease of restriction endonuclease-like (RecB) superfamily